jgi:hypothetical protein
MWWAHWIRLGTSFLKFSTISLKFFYRLQCLNSIYLDLNTGTLPPVPSDGPRVQNAFNMKLRNRFNSLSIDVNAALYVKYDETSEKMWMYKDNRRKLYISLMKHETDKLAKFKWIIVCQSNPHLWWCFKFNEEGSKEKLPSISPSSKYRSIGKKIIRKLVWNNKRRSRLAGNRQKNIR